MDDDMIDVSFDDMCHIFAYLSLDDLIAVQKLGPIFKEAVIVTARRYFNRFTLQAHRYCTIYGTELEDLCAILAECVSHLTVDFYLASVEFKMCIVQMIGDAECLHDLRLRNSSDRIDFRPDRLRSIRSLTVQGASECDWALAGYLRCCSAENLRHLYVDDMCLSGAFLAAVPGQLETLRISEVIRLDIDKVHEYINTYPALNALHLYDSFGLHNNLNILCRLLRNITELQLYVTSQQHFAALASLQHLRTLHVMLCKNETVEDFMHYPSILGPDPPLRTLVIEVHNVRFSAELANNLRRFVNLEKIIFDIQGYVDGMNEVCRALGKMPKLRHVRFGGKIEPTTPINSFMMELQQIETLHVHALLTPKLLALAQMRNLHTLRVRLVMLDHHLDCHHRQMNRDEIAAMLINTFVVQLAEANTLTCLHLQAHSGSQTICLEPATIQALRKFSNLREFVWLGKLPYVTVATMLCTMMNLQVFRNWAAGDGVYEKRDRLIRSRPDMREIKFGRWPKEL